MATTNRWSACGGRDALKFYPITTFAASNSFNNVGSVEQENGRIVPDRDCIRTHNGLPETQHIHYS